MERRRLGKGLEDISHYFISPDPKNDRRKEESSSLTEEYETGCQAVSVVDLFDPYRGALLALRIGLELCKSGVRTLLIDGDIRFPSVAFMMGLSLPGFSFRHYSKEKYQPSDIIYTGPSGIKLLAPRLSIKDLYKMDMPDMSLMLEALIDIERETDVIVLRQHEDRLQSLLGEAIFIIPASSTGITRAYRGIKSFIAGIDGKGIGIIITDAMDKRIATKAYERISTCLEMYCGMKPYFCGYLSDVSTYPVSNIISHIAGAKGGRLFFERLRYLIGVDRLTGEEIANLLD